MAKAKTMAFALRAGNPNRFRRTVKLGKGKSERKVQLVFEPDTPLELTEEEAAGLEPEISSGFIVPWNNGDRRRAPGAVPNSSDSAELETLRSVNADLREQVAELTNQVAQLTEPNDGSDLDDATDPDAPIGDE